MAKLHNYYVLCPLIDQNSFLGVSQAKEDENVIVTLGRNVVNKYRLSDQKQVEGWTSRDHITSAVIFDKEQDSYVGIFNNNIIKMWKEDAENLDKVKKYKFPVNMLKIVPRGNQPSLIVFSNGNCAALPYAIDNRKTYESKTLIKDHETIVDTGCYTVNGTDYICHIVKNNKHCYEIIHCSVRDELGDLDRSKLNRIKVSRPEDVNVIAGLICTTDTYKIAVYVLWSDNKITLFDLTLKSWKTVGSVPWMSTQSSVSLAWMGKNHIVMFGSNEDQDGAIIMAYNVKLGIGACRYPMKMYSKDAQLYCFNSRIILEASNHIGMLPYVLETKRNLSNLLGSHEIIQKESTEIAKWETAAEPEFSVADDIKKYLKLGITERSICAQVIPPLLEKDDVQHVLGVLKEFKDIPESVLVKLLMYSIKLVNPTDNSDYETFFKQNYSPEKFLLLNYLFKITFSDALMIPYLKNGLTLNDTLFILSYISYLLVTTKVEIDADYESKLLDWCTLLMDSFYQHYLVIKDDKVTVVLTKMLTVVKNVIKQIGVIDRTMSEFNKVLNYKECDNDEILPYTIEMLQI